MKKKILFSTLLVCGLFFGINCAQAMPPNHHPQSYHGVPHGAMHGHPHSMMHRPPMHHGHFHQPPRVHHHHHVRHSGFINPCYYSHYYPIGVGTRMYHPMHFGNFGIGFHINL